MFSGSYNEDDVMFLLKRISLSSTEVEDKEKNIQKGNAHYSEMITHEKAPKEEYMKLFYDTVKSNGQKFAHHIWLLAKKIQQDYCKEKEIVIVSLARAGTPVGVLLKKTLGEISNQKITHYCVSIIRDRGIDQNAMQFIIENHKDTSIVFVDGWTGKGVIGKELKNSINEINKKYNSQISGELYVVADISGTAYWSATNEDYLIPSAVLNSTVSGLVSRTILNYDYIGDCDFHGCIYYDSLSNYDVSNWFVNEIFSIIKENKGNYKTIYQLEDKILINQISKSTIKFFMEKYNFQDQNYIKPGIGESTRVLLRRIPKEIWIKDISAESVKHLVYLAKAKQIKIYTNENLSYNAIAIIEELD
jgi:uracil phosphoribosyltransferase